MDKYYGNPDQMKTDKNSGQVKPDKKVELCLALFTWLFLEGD